MPWGGDYFHILAETMKLCWQERHTRLGDPDFVGDGFNELISQGAARARAERLRSGTVLRGKPAADQSPHTANVISIDGEGNMINKRNAFQTRSTLYVRLIPPGAADVGHFRLRIPKDATGPITVEARLNYRKFVHYYTQYAYAGQPQHGSPELVSTSFDNRKFSFDPSGIPANVSGKIKGEIPNLPIVTVASAETKLPLGGGADWQPKVEKKDRERWNDWGIGLLLQGDLKGAEYAFQKVTEAEPGYVDGWVNAARALIREGEVEAAKP